MLYVEGLPGREVEIGGYAYLFFSGFAYLGMPSLPEFQQLIVEGVRKYGAVFPSSRASNTRNRLFDEFENKLSSFIGLPASACFSSGYLAAQAAIQFVSEQGNIFSLPHLHPSLKPNGTNCYSGNPNFLVEQVNQSDKPGTIILESLDPLTGKIAELHWLLEINRPVRVVIDDSHGIGILGEGGKGIAEQLPHTDHLRYLICYSLSKAFSCEGGAISGEQDDINRIKSMPPFTAATPMSPAFVYAWMNSLSLFEKQLKALKQNILYFADAVKNMVSVQCDTRLPVCRISHEKLYEQALKYHIILSAFRYPTEADPLMTRVVLNALHTKEDIDRLVYCIQEF